jgi:hypothetical protein
MFFFGVRLPSVIEQLPNVQVDTGFERSLSWLQNAVHFWSDASKIHQPIVKMDCTHAGSIMPDAYSIALGESNFLRLRENARNYFVDKSCFVNRVLTDASLVQLFPRPRRFGKTLNLTMLKAFVERDVSGGGGAWANGWAFEGLRVMRDTEFVARHAGQYPVIYLTFKDVKETSWESCYQTITDQIRNLLRPLRGLVLSDQVFPEDRRVVEQALAGELKPPQMQNLLYLLSDIMAGHSGKNVMILIDEYDTPILSAWTHGYYDEAIAFFRNFLGAGLKDNPFLAKGVLTGILRIAKESVFSGLNNLEVYSLLRHQHGSSFGFTRDEVDRMLNDFGQQAHSGRISQWYDGYLFGDETMFNPWSILNFLKAPEEGCRPYWINTSSNDLVRELVMARADSGDVLLQRELTTLLAGGVLSKAVDDHIVPRDIRSNDDSLWSLLAMSGYLKVGPRRQVDEYTVHHDLVVPNVEVMHFYRHSLWQWTLRALSSSPPRLQSLLTGLLEGDMAAFEANLANIVQESFSFHDLDGKTSERFYHAFFLGLLLQADQRYEVTSNRESGLGRYGIALIPRTAGQRGIILELKKAPKKDNLEATAREALEQARAREYVTVPRQRGASPVVLVGIALRGKEVRVSWDVDYRL